MLFQLCKKNCVLVIILLAVASALPLARALRVCSRLVFAREKRKSEILKRMRRILTFAPRYRLCRLTPIRLNSVYGHTDEDSKQNIRTFSQMLETAFQSPPQGRTLAHTTKYLSLRQANVLSALQRRAGKKFFDSSPSNYRRVIQRVLCPFWSHYLPDDTLKYAETSARMNTSSFSRFSFIFVFLFQSALCAFN